MQYGVENAISVSDVSQVEVKLKSSNVSSLTVSDFSNLAGEKNKWHDCVSVSDLSAIAESLDPINETVSVSNFSDLE
mgnify:CR=1 FL=1